jgi:hypothetical protein
VQTKFCGNPRPKFFRDYQFVEILLCRKVNAKRIERSADLRRLTGVPTLRTRPFKKYLRNNRVWRLIMTLATHQEAVGYVVCAAKGTWNDMAALKRDTIPALENFGPVRVCSFDVVLGPAVKSAGPTPRFAPIDKKSQCRQSLFPIVKYLTLQWKIVNGV